MIKTRLTLFFKVTCERNEVHFSPFTYRYVLIIYTDQLKEKNSSVPNWSRVF